MSADAEAQLAAAAIRAAETGIRQCLVLMGLFWFAFANILKKLFLTIFYIFRFDSFMYHRRRRRVSSAFQFVTHFRQQTVSKQIKDGVDFTPLLPQPIPEQSFLLPVHYQN